jgi:hypothetical protein
MEGIMPRIDRKAPLQFLRTAYEPGDWIAVLLKPHGLGDAMQRVGPVDFAASTRFQAWLRAANSAKYSIYVSVNVVQPRQRSRRREAIHAIRHIVIDVDWSAEDVLREIKTRPDLPAPSYVLHTSCDRVERTMSATVVGVLPMEEAIEAITDEAFRALADRRRYYHDGVERLQQHLREVRQHSDVVVTREDLVVTSADAREMTAAQWAMVQEIRALLPEAIVTLRIHKLAWKRDAQAPLLTVFGILVTSTMGPFTVRREYAAASTAPFPR